MKVSSKYQVTIPAKIRSQLGIKPGDDIKFICQGNDVYVEKDNHSLDSKKIIQQLKSSDNIQMTTDEILSLTRDNI